MFDSILIFGTHLINLDKLIPKERHSTAGFKMQTVKEKVQSSYTHTFTEYLQKYIYCTYWRQCVSKPELKVCFQYLLFVITS